MIARIIAAHSEAFSCLISEMHKIFRDIYWVYGFPAYAEVYANRPSVKALIVEFSIK